MGDVALLSPLTLKTEMFWPSSVTQALTLILLCQAFRLKTMATFATTQTNRYITGRYKVCIPLPLPLSLLRGWALSTMALWAGMTLFMIQATLPCPVTVTASVTGKKADMVPLT